MATGLKNLEIYQTACKLEKAVHQLVKKFPQEEQYRKKDQLKRSSSSVADNIAESYGRYGFQDKIQFLYKARGSAEEAKSQLERSVNVLPKEYQDAAERLARGYLIDIKKINGYIRYLRSKKSQFNKSIKPG